MNDDVRLLSMAFALAVAKEIVHADGVEDYAELNLMAQVFPRPLLKDAGLVQADGSYTKLFHELLDRRAELKDRLPHAEKIDLLTLLYGTCVADQKLDQREWAIVAEASELLGIPRHGLLAELAERDLSDG